MYIWGGREAPHLYYSEDSEEYGHGMYMLDVAAKHWEKVPCFGEIPIGRRSHSSVVHNDRIYVFGGFNNMVCFLY